jgi:site-specific DNA-cytosine methylase
MKALVLFKGTGSLDRSLEAAGFQVDSLDINPKCNATWTSDILQWEDWRDMAPGTYDFLWASPPCTE